MRRRFASPFAFLGLALLTAAASGEVPRLDPYGDPLPKGAIFRIGTTRLRTASDHKPAFTHLLFTPDGKFLLSGAGGEQEIRQWEIATGREVRRFPAHLWWNAGPTFCLSPNGSRLAISSAWQLELCDAATGKEKRIINVGPEHQSHRRALTWSGDGKSLVLRHWDENGGNPSDNGVLRWEAATGKNIGNWKLGAEAPLALSADGRFVASMQTNNPRITLWDAAAGKKIRDWKGEKIAALWDRCLIFSPDGQELVLAGADGRIRVYETATGKELRSWKGRSSHPHPDAKRIVYPRAVVAWLTFAPDGKILASVEDDRNVLTFWDPKTGRGLRDFEGVDGPVAFSADGKMLAAGGADSRIRLWDTASGRDLCPFPDPGRITGVHFSTDGRSLAAASEGPPQVRLLDAANGRLIHRYPDYRSLSFAPDGQSFLVQRPDESYALVDAGNGKERFPLAGAHVDWVPKSNLVLARDRSTVRVWDTASGKKVQEFDISATKKASLTALFKPTIAHSDMSFAYSENRRVAIMERNTPSIRVFSLETGKELAHLGGVSQDLMFQAQRQSRNMGQGMGGNTSLLPEFAPDGETLVAGIDRNSFGLRDVATGKWSFRFRCDQFLPHHPTFSPSGELLSLLDRRGDPCLVDAATGRVRHRLPWQEGDLFWILTSVNRMFAADSRLLAVAYDANTLVLWETATGQRICTWPGHGGKGKLRQMVFSADGRRLATVSDDGTALVWDVTGLSPDGRLPARQLTAAQTKQAWSDLADADAAKAHRAIWTLVADPARALPFLRERLHPIQVGDSRRIARLVADLDSDDFSVRDAATQELRKLKEAAEPALRAAIKDKPSLELRQRARGLLDELDAVALSAEGLRALRAVAVLEHIGGDEARQLLGVLADGAPEARLTRAAKASLARLRFRHESH